MGWRCEYYKRYDRDERGIRNVVAGTGFQEDKESSGTLEKVNWNACHLDARCSTSRYLAACAIGAID